MLKKTEKTPVENVILQVPGTLHGIPFFTKDEARSAYNMAKKEHTEYESYLGALNHMYCIAEVICGKLRISVPTITIVPNGLMIIDPKNPDAEPEHIMAFTIHSSKVQTLNEDLIVLNGELKREVMIGVLAKELRKRWQQTNPGRWSGDAQTDSDGFAVAWMHARTHYPWTILVTAIAPEADNAGLNERVHVAQTILHSLRVETIKTSTKLIIVILFIIATLFFGLPEFMAML